MYIHPHSFYCYIGILPLFSECPGCAEYCVIPEHYLGQFNSIPTVDNFNPFTIVSKPVSLSHVDCAAGLGSGLRAYTAFHTQAPIVPGNVVLITGAASVSEDILYTTSSSADFKFEICHRLMVLS